MSTPAPASSSSSGGGKLTTGVILGIAVVGVAVGIVLSITVVLCVKRLRRRKRIANREPAAPIRMHGLDSSTIFSDAQDHVHKVDISSWQPQKHSTNSLTKFSYKELQKATNNFTTLLGSGSFGPVYRADMHSTGGVLAVKVLSKGSSQGEREFQTEVALLGRLHHKNLVNLLGHCTDRRQHMLVYEYMSNGSLEKRLYDTAREPLTWPQRVQIAKDVSRGIEYLHDGAVPPVIHRDIKSANILLDSSMNAKVADFGLSKEVTPIIPTSGIKGTYGYTDPEYIFTRLFTDKSDVYSFGVLLFELLSGRHPQQGLMDYVQMATMGIEAGNPDWSELTDSRLEGRYNLQELELLASVAYRCIRKAPERRPSMRDVVLKLQRCGNRVNHSMSGLSFGFT